MNAITSPPEPSIDPGALRDVLGCYATGVAVVTALDQAGHPVGMTINSFASVSLDPPLVLWSIGLKAPSRAAFAGHPGFAINVMGAKAKEAALQFARPSEDKFAGVVWVAGHQGVPVLADALATLECRVETRIASGDHEIMIGRVVRIDRTEGPPLVFHRGTFAGLGDPL